MRGAKPFRFWKRPSQDGRSFTYYLRHNDLNGNYPYAFVPRARYEFIQSELRAKGNWSYSDSRLSVYNNFYRQFDKTFARAGIRRKGKFHDCRSTALSNWFAQGLSEYEVMKLAGHSSFETTHKFYLSIKKDYLDKARQANVGLGLKLVEYE